MSYDILSGYDDDEIGASEIIGALDILGKLGKGKARRGARLQERADKRPGENAGLERRVARLLGKTNQQESLAEVTPDTMRRYNMPLGRKSVPTTLTDLLEKTAQRTIRIERLVLSSTALPGFDVTTISIGVEVQNAAIANGPAEAFAFNAVGTTFRGNTLNVGMSASVGVLNSNPGTESISGIFFGEALQNS